ncbi:peritrophin-44-like [Musca autumnalis]|uniref:peritrophin-44-like n=1 Tax=Musca autumnalis TaxID=221902 RepID=UPI003CE80677
MFNVLMKSNNSCSLLHLVIVTFVSILTSVHGQQEAPFDPDSLCPMVAVGTKIKDPRYCNVYVECNNATYVEGSCGELYFDAELGECVDPADTICLSSQPCIGKSGAFVSDPYSCQHYYYCVNGVGTRGTCNEGMFFNSETGLCVRDFPCKITMYPEDYCNMFAEGVFIKVPRSCRAYQTCWRSQLINGTCPGGLFFNAYLGVCDDPQNVQCDEVKPEIPEYVECRVNNEFISDGINCDGYYYCQLKADGEFQMIHGTCPRGRFFDNGECVPRSHTKCDRNRCVGMGYDYMQMVNIAGDGCRGFALCQRGEEIGRSQCPEGQYFDEWEQFCVEEEVDYEACKTEEVTTGVPVEPTTTTTTTTMATTPSTTVSGESTVSTNISTTPTSTTTSSGTTTTTPIASTTTTTATTTTATTSTTTTTVPTLPTTTTTLSP